MAKREVLHAPWGKSSVEPAINPRCRRPRLPDRVARSLRVLAKSARLDFRYAYFVLPDAWGKGHGYNNANGYMSEHRVL